MDDFDEALGLSAQAIQGIAPQRVCEYLQQSLESLADALERAPHAPVHQLEVLPAAERLVLLEQWNRTEAPYPKDRCVHELFEEQVARNPAAIALVFEEQTLSYAELNARANRLARHLVQLGVRADERVALCVERSLEMVVGLLAVLKAGGAYVPLAPTYPPERLTYMLEDAAPRVLLTHAPARATLQTAQVVAAASPVVLDLLADASLWAGESDADLDPRTLGLNSHHLAYVLYTAGSTGVPKGVMVEHCNLMNYLSWCIEDYLLRPGAIAPVNTSISFDATVTSLIAPLLRGGSLYLLKEGPDELRNLGRWIAVGQDCSLIKLTPSYLHGLGQLSETH